MNKVRAGAVAVLLVVTAVTAFAADARDEMFTATFLNGRGWQKLDRSSKAFYVTGLHNGLRWSETYLGREGKILADIYIPVATFGEIAKGVDMFYADPANANVPVIFAFEIFKLRVEGKPEAEIQRETEAARKLANDLRKGE